MSYSVEKFKEYLDSNIKKIPVPIDNLHLKYGISPSKLRKDFVKAYATTWRKYLINRKIDIAYSMKSADSSITNLDLMAEINYNFTERRFRERLSQKKHDLIFSQEFGLPINFFNNKAVFEEIFLRYILNADLGKVTERRDSMLTIRHDVKNTRYQVSSFIFPLEVEHFYLVCLDVNNFQLSCSMFTKRFFEEHELTITQTTPYFGYLHTLDQIEKESNGHSIIDAITGGNSFIEEKKDSMTGAEFLNIWANDSETRLEINKDSAFIKQTHTEIENIRECMISHYENEFEMFYPIKLIEVKGYIKHVENLDFEGIKCFLEKIDVSNPDMVELLLRVTDNPRLDSIQFEKYDECVSKTLLDKLVFLDKFYIYELIIGIIGHWEDDNEDFLINYTLEERIKLLME